jgi:hypothetical protein
LDRGDPGAAGRGFEGGGEIGFCMLGTVEQAVA